MVPSDDYKNLARGRYERLRFGEPVVRSLYQQRHAVRILQKDEDEEEDPTDVLIREQYIIESTGAVLTYGSAVSLLNHLCALIPREDRFTKSFQPKYEGDFQVTVTLPSVLPIPRDRLRYEGGIRNTKREAKAAAAFAACKALYDPLKVFDEYLLPTRKTSGHEVRDADERLIPDVDRTNNLLDMLVCDPWLPWNIDAGQITFVAWIHPLVFPEHDHSAMGLMTAGPLSAPLPEVLVREGWICFTASRCVNLPCSVWQIAHAFTALGIKWCNTSKSVSGQLTCFLILLDTFGNPDFEQMQAKIDRPTREGVDIKHLDANYALLQDRYQKGRPLILRELRDDLTPLSEPTFEDSPELMDLFSTYSEYFEFRYSNPRYRIPIPSEGALLSVRIFRNVLGRLA